MKVLYDHQTFSMQQFGGISRYFYELIKRFDGKDNICDVASLVSNNSYYNKDVNPKLRSFFKNKEFKGKSRIIKEINENYSKKTINKGEFDVFHPTYYDTYFLKKIGRSPFVVTFHDVIHEKFSGQFESLKLDSKMFDNKKSLLNSSSKIIAISETTKKDIVEFFDIDASKIEVIYHGNSFENVIVTDKRLIDEDYILFVGNRSIYKNFDFFVKGVADLLIDNKLKLVCAGGGDFDYEELMMLQGLKLQNHVVYKKIHDDTTLSNYYQKALFFVFPSLYEGFGIPILESFACGCPVLLSNGGSLPEIGGDAAEYFDPTDDSSLKTAVNKLISDQSLRDTLKEKGRLRLKKFSWDKTFNETLKIYQSVV